MKWEFDGGDSIQCLRGGVANTTRGNWLGRYLLHSWIKQINSLLGDNKITASIVVED